MSVSFSKTLPLRRKTDIVIAGGGIAGVCAAVAAAETGRKVLLIERFGVTGGNATAGGVGAFCGETRGQGKVFDEIVMELERFHAIAPYQPYGQLEARTFNHEILAFILQELLLRHGVELLLHTMVADCVRDGDKITHCAIAGPGGLEAVSAEVFIDCTGEAVLVHTAGFPTMKGNDIDHGLLPMALMFFVRHTLPGDDLPVVPDGFIERFQEDSELPSMSVWPNGPRSNGIKVKIPLGDATDSEGFTAAEIRGRRRMMQIIDFLSRVKKRPWMLDHCSPQIGIREGRRVIGDYVLKVDDLRAGRHFDDGIARGVFYLDRPTSEDKSGFTLSAESRKVPPYQIPFRSLVVKGADNLLVAGRCFSGDQLALSSARVMTTCAMMGQAAGIGAAMAMEVGGMIRELNYREIGREAKSRGAILDYTR